MTAGIRKVAPIPIIATVPLATVAGNGFRVPATVDLSWYPEYGNCHISRVVDLYLLLDYEEAGEPVCAEWPGVGHGMGYVYCTVTPDLTCLLILMVLLAAYLSLGLKCKDTATCLIV